MAARNQVLTPGFRAAIECVQVTSSKLNFCSSIASFAWKPEDFEFEVMAVRDKAKACA